MHFATIGQTRLLVCRRCRNEKSGLKSELVLRGWFDGSADVRANEVPPSPPNTNNRAEYQALLGLLADYIAQGHQGPLLVHGDSEVIIKPGEWRLSRQ